MWKQGRTEVGAMAHKWNTIQWSWCSTGVIHLSWNLLTTKARLTLTKHPLRKQRKLSKVIFWLVKLATIICCPHGNLHDQVVRWIQSALFLLLSPQNVLNSLSSIFPLSLFSPPSVLVLFFHPLLLLRLWFPGWTLGSALSCHMIKTQRSRQVKYKAPNSKCIDTPQSRHIRRSLSCYTVSPSEKAFFLLHWCNLSPQLALRFHSHEQVGGTWRNLEW